MCDSNQGLLYLAMLYTCYVIHHSLCAAGNVLPVKTVFVNTFENKQTFVCLYVPHINLRLYIQL